MYKNHTSNIGILRIIAALGLIFAGFAVSFLLRNAVFAQATCSDLGSSFGSANYDLSAVEPGDHRMWLRVKSIDGTAELKYNLSGGGTSCDNTITDSSASNWTWVQSSVLFTTTGGDVAVQLAGTKTGVGVDCFVLTSDTSFTPTGETGCLGPQEADTTLPSTSISVPSQNASIVGGSVSVEANATDDVAVSMVDLYLNGSLHSSDSAAPYAYAIPSSSLSTGSHQIYAVATDTSGNTAQSSVVDFTYQANKPGDVNGDGSVNLSDFFIIRVNFNQTGVSRADGDLNGDGSVTLADFFILRQNFGS